MLPRFKCIFFSENSFVLKTFKQTFDVSHVPMILVTSRIIASGEFILFVVITLHYFHFIKCLEKKTEQKQFMRTCISLCLRNLSSQPNRLLTGKHENLHHGEQQCMLYHYSSKARPRVLCYFVTNMKHARRP